MKKSYPYYYPSKPKHYYLYILRLQHGKHYVGTTTNLRRRISQHKSGHGAQWTKRYRYAATVKQVDLGYVTKKQAELREHEYAKAYIKKYGLNNARGGGYNYGGDYVNIGIGYIPMKNLPGLIVGLIILGVPAFLLLLAILASLTVHP